MAKQQLRQRQPAAGTCAARTAHAAPRDSVQLRCRTRCCCPILALHAGLALVGVSQAKGAPRQRLCGSCALSGASARGSADSGGLHLAMCGRCSSAASACIDKCCLHGSGGAAWHRRVVRAESLQADSREGACALRGLRP
jgi:hypothetical protein